MRFLSGLSSYWDTLYRHCEKGQISQLWDLFVLQNFVQYCTRYQSIIPWWFHIPAVIIYFYPIWPQNWTLIVIYPNTQYRWVRVRMYMHFLTDVTGQVFTFSHQCSLTPIVDMFIFTHLSFSGFFQCMTKNKGILKCPPDLSGEGQNADTHFCTFDNICMSCHTNNLKKQLKTVFYSDIFSILELFQ